jgi:hypothetical protein
MLAADFLRSSESVTNERGSEFCRNIKINKGCREKIRVYSLNIKIAMLNQLALNLPSCTSHLGATQFDYGVQNVLLAPPLQISRSSSQRSRHGKVPHLPTNSPESRESHETDGVHENDEPHTSPAAM